MQEYTAQEVARHNHEKDIWMSIHGYVYDLTNFLKEHPGGEEVLLTLAGQDGTECFDEIGHSQEGIQLRDTLRIGRLVGGSNNNNNDSGSTQATESAQDAISGTIDDDDWQYEEPKNEGSSMLPIFLALGAMVYAVIFYYVFWRE